MGGCSNIVSLGEKWHTSMKTEVLPRIDQLNVTKMEQMYLNDCSNGPPKLAQVQHSN